MNLVEYAEFLVKELVNDSDLVKVKSFESEDGTILEILISEEDLPFVIGKGGKVANSLKTLIRTKAYLESINDIKINIDSF